MLLLAFLACTPTPEGPDAATLLAALGECAPLDGMPGFATDISDAGRPTGEFVELCGVDGAVWWRADLDVTCAGGRGEACASADPTSTTTAAGDFLDAVTVPYAVAPLPWQPYEARDADFFYCDHGLSLGGPVAVVYEDTVVFGVIGDEGPVTDQPSGADGTCAGTPYAGGVIGGASYAMAEALGIDPDPATGGVVCDGNCPVTYVFFTAPAVDPVEDPEAAEAAAIPLALALTGDQ